MSTKGFAARAQSAAYRHTAHTMTSGSAWNAGGAKSGETVIVIEMEAVEGSLDAV
jgi:hypothetical protein